MAMVKFILSEFHTELEKRIRKECIEITNTFIDESDREDFIKMQMNEITYAVDDFDANEFEVSDICVFREMYDVDDIVTGLVDENGKCIFAIHTNGAGTWKFTILDILYEKFNILIERDENARMLASTKWAVNRLAMMKIHHDYDFEVMVKILNDPRLENIFGRERNFMYRHGYAEVFDIFADSDWVEGKMYLLRLMKDRGIEYKKKTASMCL